jgi:hypothetical protein
MIAGASTGGIIALALGMGLTAQEVLDVYMTRGGEIFPRRRDFGLIRPAYKPDVLAEELRRLFGARLFGEAQTRLCVPSADGRHGDVAVFKTPHHPDFRKDWSMSLIDVALATSAAPTFLRVHQAGGYQFIDGGVWANNPVMIGVVDALSCFDIDRRQLSILSVGNGTRKPILGAGQVVMGGALGWLHRGALIESMMHYSVMNADGQAGLLVGRDRLARIHPGGDAANVHMTDYAGAVAHLPRAAAAAADTFSDAGADRFLKVEAAAARFYHGPRDG